MNLTALEERIRARLSPEWLTPSQQEVWEDLHRFEGPPHRIVNVYGSPGSGKSFLGWLMERERYATYCLWSQQRQPAHPRLALDNAYTDRQRTRALRPKFDELGVRQVILLSRHRVDEKAMPIFELRVTADDLEYFWATLYRQLGIILPEEEGVRDYATAINNYLRRESDGS